MSPTSVLNLEKYSYIKWGQLKLYSGLSFLNMLKFPLAQPKINWVGGNLYIKVGYPKSNGSRDMIFVQRLFIKSEFWSSHGQMENYAYEPTMHMHRCAQI